MPQKMKSKKSQTFTDKKKIKPALKKKSPVISDDNARVVVAQKAAKKKLIEIKDLQKNYEVVKGHVKVLKDINLTIYKGEFLLILGPSGSGKSTLLNSLMGLERPSSGQIIYNGIDIAKMSEDKRAQFRLKNMGIIFQKPDWIKSLNVIENVSFPLALANMSSAQQGDLARKRLEDIGILDHAEFRPYELSAGQQELVEFARALVLDPEIIVADEPTGNLDSDTAHKIMGLFQEMNQKQGKTILMVTHNISHLKYATRTIYIKDGQVLDGMKHEEELEEYESTPVI